MTNEYDKTDLGVHANQVLSAFSIASKTLPKQVVARKRPWISESTLNLIDARRLARSDNNYAEELRLSKLVRISAKNDKREYLQVELSSGSWNCVKKLRRKVSVKHASIRDISGKVVELSERSNTLAKYFEQVQWKVPFADLVPDATTMVNPILPVSVENFTVHDLHRVLSKLKAGKAPGYDDVPSDFWKILSGDEGAVHELLGLCIHCWELKQIPDIWRVAKVVLLFKKRRR